MIFLSQLPAILIIVIISYSIYKKNNTFLSFVNGAKEGLKICISIFPTLFALIFAIELFVKTEFADFFKIVLRPLMYLLHIPEEALVVIILKPFSGSGALSYVKNIFERFGPDSKEGLFSSVYCASTETLFYVIATYLSVTKVRKIRYLIIVALLVDLTAIVLTSLIIW